MHVHCVFCIGQGNNKEYTTLAWEFKGVARCLTRILPEQYQDISRAISWESGLPLTLIPSQFKETIHFDSLY